MADLIDQIIDTFPANDDVGVPLRAAVTIKLTGVDYDLDSLIEGTFLEGPDTDQFIGPGQISLSYPNNVSQGDIDDFFESPGRKGIVPTVVTAEEVDGGTNTLVSVISNLPFAASLLYTLTMGDMLASDGVTPYDGFATFSFTTGSGSIEEVPASVSTSPIRDLSSTVPSISPELLAISQIFPEANSIEVDSRESIITVTFDKDIDIASLVEDEIIVAIEPTSDHPSVVFEPLSNAVKVITINGNVMTIRV